jgi:hypothetical protein
VAMDTVTQGIGLDRHSVAVVRRVFEALPTGDMSAVNELIAPAPRRSVRASGKQPHGDPVS